MTSSHYPATGAGKLGDFLCFATYSASLAFGRAHKPLLDKHSITYTQWIAIVALWEQDHQTVNSLGEKLFLQSNTLTPTLKRLEELGFLRRRRNPADERQVFVSLTDAGQGLREDELSTPLIKATGLDPDECAQIQRSVVRVRDNILKYIRNSA
jgi:DNA-binding MarR family transcriptional regulator